MNLMGMFQVLRNCQHNAFVARPTKYLIRLSKPPRRNQSSSASAVNFSSLLAKPSWSVCSLLPEPSVTGGSLEITSTQLHHLLRLSALPLPESGEEERRMRETLSSQLHFVKQIQRVHTTDVEPLRSIRDETGDAKFENQLTVDKLQAAFDKEEVRGWSKRIERKQDLKIDTKDAEAWDVLGHASKKMGRYFVVETASDH